jgi:hypothetical protein
VSRGGASANHGAPPVLQEFVAGQIWLVTYPVRYAGLDFTARMSVIRLPDGSLMLHSPCDIDDSLAAALRELGPVRHIVAPGSFHYLHVASAQAAFPEAVTYVCPGIERKRPELEFDWLLGDVAPEAWRGTLDQVLVRGTRFIWEVAFLHVPSKTLLLVDLIENIGDATPDTDWKLKLWWKAVFHMWNRPRPAPEYQIGWGDKKTVRAYLERILAWDFDRIVLAHGDLILSDAKARAEEAWRVPLSHR